MAKIQQDILLGRINREIKNGAKITSSLSEGLQQDIKDTVDPIVANQGLKKVHSFLMQFVPQSSRRYFEWPA